MDQKKSNDMKDMNLDPDLLIQDGTNYQNGAELETYDHAVPDLFSGCLPSDCELLRWGAAWIVAVFTVPVIITAGVIEGSLAHYMRFPGLFGVLYITSWLCATPATLGMLAVAVLRAVWGWQHISLWIALGATITGLAFSLWYGGTPRAAEVIGLSIGGALAAALAWMVVFAGQQADAGPS